MLMLMLFVDVDADAVIDAAAGFIGLDVDAVDADAVDADAVTYADAADDVC